MDKLAEIKTTTEKSFTVAMEKAQDLMLGGAYSSMMAIGMHWVEKKIANPKYCPSGNTSLAWRLLMTG